MIKKANDLTKIQDYITTWASGWGMIYKHSDTCSVCHAALAVLDKFEQSYPDIPIAMLEVKSQRELSNQIAAEYEVPHESPQLLIFKDGILKQTKNHFAIRQEWLVHIVEGWYAG